MDLCDAGRRVDRGILDAYRDAVPERDEPS